MKKMRSAWLILGFVVLTGSCGFPRLSELTDVGGGVDAGAGTDGGSDGAPLPIGLELLAGDIGGPGNADGTGTDARFTVPRGVAVDRAGNIYVADTFNHTVRKITAAGVVTTLAGTAGLPGSANGTGAAARFAHPRSVAIDNDGNVYVADQGNNTIRKVTAGRVVTTLAGTAGMFGSADGTGAAARFRNPAGVAVDSESNVYVGDTGNHTVRKITAGGVVTTLAGTAGMPGSADGTGAAARFSGPSGMAVDSAGNVYVADQNNHTIRKVTDTGIVTTLAGTAGIPGSANGAAARFNLPSGVAVDSDDNVYVADEGNHTIRKVTAGAVTTLAGTAGLLGSENGTGAAARFNLPSGVAVDSDGDVYVADQINQSIRKVVGEVVTTLAGAASVLGRTDGTGTAARFNLPSGVAVDSTGNMYVADLNNHTIRKVTPTGGVTTLAGFGGNEGSADGTGAAARFRRPSDVAVDSADNIYVADGGNDTIRKITAGGVVTTLAGTAGVVGSADGTGATASFNVPRGVAVDSDDNVYVADSLNHTIRKVLPGGVVTTLAGSAGMFGSAEGTGAAARFNAPSGVAVDSNGNVYVADTGNHTVRKVTSARSVTTVAGTAGMPGSADGTGAAARFFRPSGMAVDSDGNVYVTDANLIIRKVTATGVATTVAGTVGASGILLGPIPRFSSPRGLAILGDSIIVSDANAILLLRHGAQ